MLLAVLALRQDGRNNAVHAVGNVGRFTNAVEVVAVAGWPQRQQKRGVLWEGTSKILRVLLDDLVDLGGGGGGGVREIGLYFYNVGCTRCVTSSTATKRNRHAR